MPKNINRERTKVASFYFQLKKGGVNFASGVPCAAQKNILPFFFNDPEMIYIKATREEDAVGVATGAYLAGKKPIVLMQNSGLANCINALASLCIPYKIPILMLVTWRGYPKDKNEPLYHHVMGKSTIKLMNDLGIPIKIIPEKNPHTIISLSIKEMRRQKRPVVMLLKRHIFK